MLRRLITTVTLLLLSSVARADIIAFARMQPNSSGTNRMPIYVMNSDGTSEVQLNASVSGSYMPYSRLLAISPDGSKIAYSYPVSDVSSDIHVITINGGEDKQITSGPEDDIDLRWSPDGTKIVFRRTNLGDQYFCMVNADGTDLRRIGSALSGPGGRNPSFSPDGNKLAFNAITPDRNESGQPSPYTWDIYTMSLDGSNVQRATYTRSATHGAAWAAGRLFFIDGPLIGNLFSAAEDGADLRQLSTSPIIDGALSSDGNHFVIASSQDGGNMGNIELYSMNSDGSSFKRLTTTPESEYYPTWGAGVAPIPTPAPTATPLPNAVPVVSFQLPQRGIRLNNGLPFEVRIEATDADGNDDIRDVSLAVQRSSDDFFWDGRSWGPNSIAFVLSRETGGATYYKELNLGYRTQPDNYILTARAVDQAGAVGNAVTAIQLVDWLAPSITITQPEYLSRITSLPVVSGMICDFQNYSLTYSFAQRVVVSLRRGSDGKYWTGSRWSDAYTLLATSLVKYGWTCTARLPQGSELTAGTLYITAIGYDKVGNSSTVTRTFMIRSPASSIPGLSIITTDSATGTIRLRYESPLTMESATNLANYAVQLGAVRVPVEDIRYEGGVVTLLLGADALPSGEAVTVTWRNLQRATGSGTFAGRTTVTVRQTSFQRLRS